MIKKKNMISQNEDSWSKNNKKISFEEGTKQDEQGFTEKDDDSISVYFLKSSNESNKQKEENSESERPTETSKVSDAKEDELNKWKAYDAYEKVDEKEADKVLSLRWVITEKKNPDDNKSNITKARLCVRGFEEDNYPKSDSPTASHESLKIFLALAANSDFKVRALDVKSAFLQGLPINRDIYVQPPEEACDEGYVWKLKKSAYGLYDASRRWFLAVKELLLSLGMKQAKGHEAVFYKTKNEVQIHIE